MQTGEEPEQSLEMLVDAAAVWRASWAAQVMPRARMWGLVAISLWMGWPFISRVSDMPITNRRSAPTENITITNQVDIACCVFFYGAKLVYSQRYFVSLGDKL